MSLGRAFESLRGVRRCADCDRELLPSWVSPDPTRCPYCAERRAREARLKAGLCAMCGEPYERGLLDALPRTARLDWSGEFCRTCATRRWERAWLASRLDPEEGELLAPRGDIVSECDMPGVALLGPNPQLLRASATCGCSFEPFAYPGGLTPEPREGEMCFGHGGRPVRTSISWSCINGPKAFRDEDELTSATYLLSSVADDIDMGINFRAPDASLYLLDLLKLRTTPGLDADLQSAREAVLAGWPVTSDQRKPASVLRAIRQLMYDAWHGTKQIDGVPALGSPSPSHEITDAIDPIEMLLREATDQAFNVDMGDMDSDEAGREIARVASGNRLLLEAARQAAMAGSLDPAEDVDSRKEFLTALQLLDIAIANGPPKG